MNDYKEFMMAHWENCEYCQRAEESKILSEDRKAELINKHAYGAMWDYADYLKDAYYER